MVKFLIVNTSILISVACIIGFIIFRKNITNAHPNDVIRLILKKADRGDVALTVRRNQKEIVNLNGDVALPLASAVKTLIAIEYARQAAAGLIDPTREVSFAELDAFYIPGTDGGAHEAWMSSLQQEDAAGRASLSDVVKGMMTYSSNANTEFLMNLLGLDKINQLLETLKLNDHEPIYPFVSAMAIPYQLKQEKNLSKKQLLRTLREMDMSEYRQRAIEIHRQWLKQPPTDQEKKRLRSLLSLDVQRVWSDRLPRSTTRDYVSIMSKLNSKTFFDRQTHERLDRVIEQLMTNPNNRERLVRSGQKGGSTAFVVTMAMYATDRDRNQTEMAFFSNRLTIMEQIKLTRAINDFQLNVLTNQSFRKRLQEQFKSKKVPTK